MSSRAVGSLARAAASPAPAASSCGAIIRRMAPSAIGACTDGRLPSRPVLSGRQRGYCAGRHLDRRRYSLLSGRPSGLLSAGGDGQILHGTSRVAPPPSSPLRRAISSSPRLLEDSAEPKPAEAAEGGEESKEGEGDPCPEWQNPLHHDNPEYDGSRVLSEDFAPGEEMPSVPLPPFASGDGRVLASPELHALADEIVRLNMIEVKELVDRIGDHFGFEDDVDGTMGGGGDEGEGGGASEEKVEEEERTAFDVKLTGFDAKSKIKVIKEVRGVTSLGLKEAKELVEGAPTTVKKDVKKEEAEELKAKLEAVGATVEIV